MDKVCCTRIFSGADGESHFADAEFELRSVSFAPPAPPMELSAFMPASQCAFLSAQHGLYGDWHPAPCRQFIVNVAGETEIEVSDGSVRRVGPGSILLVEDTTGRGHRSRVLGTVDLIAMVVQLPG